MRTNTGGGTCETKISELLLGFGEQASASYARPATNHAELTIPQSATGACGPSPADYQPDWTVQGVQLLPRIYTE